MIAALGIDTVRRPTGGRAVWHDAEVTYAVAGPASAFGSLQETYNIVHVTLAAALRRLGVDAELAARPSARQRGVAGGACFASPAGGEIVVGNLKLVGSSQVREGDAFLQHGSILLDGNQNIVAQVTRGDATRPNSTSLSSLLGRAVTFSEVAEAVMDEAAQSWNGTWQRCDTITKTIDRERFTDPAWTWRR
jgi:lipoate-protein ligase A